MSCSTCLCYYNSTFSFPKCPFLCHNFIAKCSIPDFLAR
nr:MAG TPA: hypothetical protein [Caudoviricetes sp.]